MSFSKVSLVLFSIVLMSFKYPINGFFNSGVRIDDFVLIMSVVLFIMSHKNLYLPKFTIYFLSFFAIMFFSAVVSKYNELGVDDLSLILFTVRHLQYMTAILLGLLLVGRSLDSLLKLFTAYQFVIVVLQKYGFLGFGTLYNIAHRQVGSTGGPWELAVLISLPFFYFLYKKEWGYLLISFFVLYSTSSRVTMISVLSVVLINEIMVNRFLISKNKILKWIFCSIGLLIIGGYYYYFSFGLSENNIYSRILAIKDFDFISFSHVDLSGMTREQFSNIDQGVIKSSFGNASGDISAYSRFSRWSLALYFTFNYSLFSPLIGLGPAFFGDALDGGYIRVLSTTGFTGLLLYLTFLFKLHSFFKKNAPLYILSFFYVYCFSCLLIDINYSIKSTVVLWVLVGYVYGTYRMELKK